MFYHFEWGPETLLQLRYLYLTHLKNIIFISISSLFIEHHNRWCYNFCFKHQIYLKNLWEEGYSTIFIPVFNPSQFYISGLLRYKWQIKLLQYLDGTLWLFDKYTLWEDSYTCHLTLFSSFLERTFKFYFLGEFQLYDSIIKYSHFLLHSVQFSQNQFSHSVVSDSLWPHEP